ncbi:MAG: methylmalonyl Co-A mutase-associated GTPase MeaB [Granulosicoccus sp.]|nr:methylmalonyl Co-A mutase-associated GTPase MeaB [Granulosicoccus sp.]
MVRSRLSSEALAAGVLARERATLARAITLTESTLASHQVLAQEVLQRLLPRTGKAMRVGISGVPGVGKSTFIESLGLRLIERGHRVAVLAVDPSSQRTGGSILGDKTRMARLSLLGEAFIRPSPTGGHLGGVTRVTRESMLLCEAAGFDVILVETVGVGQSETVVADMVDCYLVLMLPGAGDELQGIKKGVLELADIIAVNKADGSTLDDARQARAAYQRALSILQPAGSWKPLALTCSAVSGDGLEDLWEQVRAHRRQLIDSGELVARREQQLVRWMWSMVDQMVLASLRDRSELQPLIMESEQAVRQQKMTALQAANALIKAWRGSHTHPVSSPEPTPRAP